MNISINSEENTKSNDLITRFTGCLNCSKQCQQKLKKQVEKLDAKINETGILVGKTPSAIASGMIYFILEKNKMSVNKKELASQHNISVVTLNKIVHIIESHSDFLQIDEL
jgi:transcription initiation factor TFIIIB Brf1 subunit/transcription initiation factor TFIIB